MQTILHMSSRNYLQQVELTNPKYLQTLVENRRIFNLKNCELNIFESYKETYRVPLTFDNFVITSMVRGKKIMHLFNEPAFDYLPGETVIVPANETMVIDFPEAQIDSPTQCIAVSVDQAYITDTLQYLNLYYNNDPDNNHEWKLQFNKYHFDNDTEVTDLINKLIRICSSDSQAKNIYADLNLKELLIRLLQSQYLQQVKAEKNEKQNHTRRHFVINYIHQHLTDKIEIDGLCRMVYMSRNAFFRWFKEQFGMTPLDYINKERIQLSKQLLSNEEYKISSVGVMSGFADANYFARMFKKMEGITPGSYRECQIK